MDTGSNLALAALGSKVAEFEIRSEGMVVSGSKTVQVEIKE